MNNNPLNFCGISRSQLTYRRENIFGRRIFITFLILGSNPFNRISKHNYIYTATNYYSNNNNNISSRNRYWKMKMFSPQHNTILSFHAFFFCEIKKRKNAKIYSHVYAMLWSGNQVFECADKFGGEFR